MKKITPHLWFDKEAKEAAEFYTSVFPHAKGTNVTTLHDTPSGDCDLVSFELAGQPFMAISAGPLFKFSPSVSFIVNFDPERSKGARENITTSVAAACAAFLPKKEKTHYCTGCMRRRTAGLYPSKEDRFLMRVLKPA
ncbi:MAG: hypothetical protein E6J34_03100 [Chloroflexi bacterium]|nr:MAG: hypothetical protein E6J34_03100 [Chloroflexota bacterium]